MSNKLNIVFAWPELPEYASLYIDHLNMNSNFNITVVATKAKLPIKNIGKNVSFDLIWLENKNNFSWHEIGVAIPDVLFIGNYKEKQFIRLLKDARINGTTNILMADNYNYSIFYSLLNAIFHRLTIRNMFDGIFVPGEAAVKNAQLWGYPVKKVFSGLYGADPTIFQNKLALKKRVKRFTFVGQFINRKNIIFLIEAFIKFSYHNPDWELFLFGTGKLKKDIPPHAKISVFDFSTPKQIAHALQQSRCLILPSKKEHWGVVVHEAVSCGCAILLSKTVGSRHDFLTVSNGFSFDPNRVDELYNTLEKISDWKQDDWDKAEAVSEKLAKNFSPKIFTAQISKIIYSTRATND